MDLLHSDSGHKEREIYSVQRLNQEVKQLLQQSFPLIWIEGELSNVAQPASGHVYFSLKDEHAQVRSVMFQHASRLLPFQPKEGMFVLVRARVGLYEPRGEFQLIVEQMEKAGTGILQRRFEALKRKLNNEGLFSSVHKQPLPPFPASLYIVTSATGAALRDILSVLGRRFPLLAIQVYSIPVQGEASANEIVEALQVINQRKDGDVIILARGGGSIEDLWSFNEESVARAIFASKLPVVTGIGHEVDFTIADYVADLRAPTPSAAAELVVPHARTVLETLEKHRDSANHLIRNTVSNLHQSVDWISQQLEHLHPKLTVQRNKQLLIEMARRLESATMLQHSRLDNNFINLLFRFGKLSPKSHVHESDIRLTHLYKNLKNLLCTQMEQRNQKLEAWARSLDTASPLATLSRGYSIVTLKNNGQILRETKQVSQNEKIMIQLAKGRLNARIE